jgi:hypothetical protein
VVTSTIARPPPRGVDTWWELRVLGTSTRPRASAALRIVRVRSAAATKAAAATQTVLAPTRLVSATPRLIGGIIQRPRVFTRQSDQHVTRQRGIGASVEGRAGRTA